MAASATIKAIEASSIHQIQSGQVIVDLCSVAKELVENSLDAGATSIEVRFKNQGLDSIEVLDNGFGISPQNYESLALKHYTSKLSTYSDLNSLQTFGFRGEALSSLCALSHFTVVTCLQSDVPKGTKLEFETSGKLKGTSVVAAQKGTTVSVEKLFYNLPVRRRELERNIKREWGKVISLLNQYACIQTGVKFTVSQQPNKGRRIVLFSTKGNPTTRENIVNVLGAKTMGALVALDLKLELEPTSGLGQRWSTHNDGSTREIHVKGFVSRPIHGEGRQTPDRQMFYVNGRPCGLPQFAKVFNEVYRSYNISQSPFVFADIQLDTHLYDVNVSPDKRTILLHDQGRMLDNMRDSLVELFEAQDYTVPVAMAFAKQTPFKKLSVARRESQDTRVSDRSDSRGETPGLTETTHEHDGDASEESEEDEGEEEEDEEGAMEPIQKSRRTKASVAPGPRARDTSAQGLISRWMERKAELRAGANTEPSKATREEAASLLEDPEQGADEALDEVPPSGQAEKNGVEEQSQEDHATPTGPDQRHQDFHAHMSELAGPGGSDAPVYEEEIIEENEAHREPSIPAIAAPTSIQDNRAVPSSSLLRAMKRSTQEVATITIGDHTVTSIIGTPSKRLRVEEPADRSSPQKQPTPKKPAAPLPSFGGRLTQMFAAGTPTHHHESGRLRSPSEDSEDAGDGIFVSDNDSANEGSSPEEEAQGSEERDSEEEDLEIASSHASDDVEAASGSAPEDASFRSNSENGEAEYVQGSDAGAESPSQGSGAQEVANSPANDGTGATEDTEKRSQAFVKGGAKKKDQTLQYLQRLKTSENAIRKQLRAWQNHSSAFFSKGDDDVEAENGLEADDAEEKLSLIISKADFAKMKIIGQFNLGFILAVRGGESYHGSSNDDAQSGDLFIIDQHASDEKYNFERLQASTVVQSQRLVRPKHLELTALEEEIIIENQAALETNGFVVSVDESGDEPVGSRCQLLSLPLSRETTFSLADLEELISLLGDQPSSSAAHVPRPSKVRKMFAMRACRSSIMIGRALSQKQMERVVRHMGEMEKPWNCPHGRPTMRHLCGLRAWDEKVWTEGDDFDTGQAPTDWAAYVRQSTES
ncbi:Mismatch repair endonuclease PMS2 [Pleurostoma richardsiae]|uniref:DNA mismatch repair protein PMS1 n=1 Tax=Pleurostoma richardsiae TaxID=41990 RepID=A0AA38VVJ0_9PEZI|nr:Mismatch repair endonuclease PMS2 [Pleurostoma richardsiae]